MTGPAGSRVDWSTIDLVAFDVDGTLYDQRALRRRMAVEMMRNAVVMRTLRTIKVIHRYRRIRERLAQEEAADFETQLIIEAAQATRSPPQLVREIALEWLERRPLPHLAACRYPGLQPLFQAIAGRRKLIGVVSDYPAQAKLDALALRADVVVCASDEGVGLLKPHPRSLQVLMSKAGVPAERSLLIGDRFERDGVAARRAGVRSLIRCDRTMPGFDTFGLYDDAVFSPLLTGT